jgi:TrmH family RNA methyltransferase
MVRREPGILARTRVVLVSVKQSGNLGSVARVMKNMGLERLVLVAPRAEVDRAAREMAYDAHDVLLGAERVSSFDEAVAGCELTIGTAGRTTRWEKSFLEPSDAVRLARAVGAGELALVFGSEDDGLPLEILDACDWVASVPTSAAKQSMNLSHAVAVVLYELRKQSLEAREEKAASRESVGALLARIETKLAGIGFLKRADPRRIMLKLAKIAERARLTDRDVRSLHAVMEHIEKNDQPAPRER